VATLLADIDGRAPKREVWRAGEEMVRVFSTQRGPLQFNPTASSQRFRPIYDARGNVVPTAYTARDEETALAETLLRGQAGSTLRTRLYAKEVRGTAMVKMTPTRDLALAALHGTGLKALRLQRSDIIDTTEDGYPATAQVAQYIHDHEQGFDGLIWTSHQNDSERALMLFGDRVQSTDLQLVGAPLALDAEPGLSMVRALCLNSSIDFDG
jgi:hypothetical protein